MPLKREYMSLHDMTGALLGMKEGWVNHLWFMTALFFVYILVPVLKPAYDTSTKGLYFFLAILFILTMGNTLLNNIGQVINFVAHKNYISCDGVNFFDGFNPFSGLYYAYVLVYFILGGLIFKYRHLLSGQRKVLIAVVTILSSTAVWTAYGTMRSYNCQEYFDPVWNGYDAIPTLLSVIGVFTLALRYKGGHRWWERLIEVIGKNTLGIYLIHRLWAEVVIRYVHYSALPENIAGSVILGMIILFASLLTVLICKQIPLLRELFNI
jgi:surface polysaccharide O-acyltransferase-like enzyme